MTSSGRECERKSIKENERIRAYKEAIQGQE